MSSAPQVSSTIDYEPKPFETDSYLPSRSQSVATSCPSVLLVGRNGSWGSQVLKPLEKFGTELSFVLPSMVTPEYVRKGAYTLVLLDSTVHPEQRKQLVSELIGSRTSIFYSFPVENGCWWLPALMRGQDCHGAPAFRRKDFPVELERILGDQAEA